MRAARRLAGLAVLAALAGGCKGDATAPVGTIAAFITSVQLAGTSTTATLVQGDAPAAGSGPTLTLSAPVAAINGGTSEVGVTGSAEFQVVVIAVPGLPNHYELTLPAAATTASLLLTMAQNLSIGTFQIQFAAGPSTASLGAYATQSLNIVAVGTGEVQVSVSWNSLADIDLHVVEPGGEEVFWGNSQSGTGGELDLDSNAACGSDGPRNENVTWADGTAPAGEYIVRVDNWSACGATRTDWVVTVQVRGRQPEVYTGFFTDAGDGGGVGSGVEVTRFTK